MTDQLLATEPETKTDQTGDQFLDKFLDSDGKRKYDTVEKAMSALEASQNHIKTLEAENKVYRESSDQSGKLDTLIEAISNKETSETNVQETLVVDPATEVSKGFGEVDIQSTVEKLIIEREQKAKAEANVIAVKDKLESVYGDKSGEALVNFQKSSELSQEFINQLAKESPSTLLKLMGVDSKTNSGEKVTSTIQTQTSNTLSSNDIPSVMGARTTADVSNAWLKSKELTNKRLGI